MRVECYRKHLHMMHTMKNGFSVIDDLSIRFLSSLELFTSSVVIDTSKYIHVSCNRILTITLYVTWKRKVERWKSQLSSFNVFDVHLIVLHKFSIIQSVNNRKHDHFLAFFSVVSFAFQLFIAFYVKNGKCYASFCFKRKIDLCNFRDNVNTTTENRWKMQSQKRENENWVKWHVKSEKS
jgi:hypothetical protein